MTTHDDFSDLPGLLEQARAEVERLRFELSLAQRRAEVELDNYDQARAERDALREAARALVNELDAGSVSTCDWHRCEAIATRFLSWKCDSAVFCDKHAKKELRNPDVEPPLRNTETAIAAPLRAMRALLRVKP